MNLSDQEVLDYYLGTDEALDWLDNGSSEMVFPEFRTTSPEREPIIVGDRDTRKRIKDTQQAPFRYICSIELISSSGSTQTIGTGTLVGSRSVLTAAHVLFRTSTQLWSASQIRITPARNGSSAPFGNSGVSRLIPNPKYVHHRKAGTNPKRILDALDYGIIHLQKPLGNSAGYWGKRPNPSFDPRGTSITGAALPVRAGTLKVNIAGYPGDKGGITQWSAFDQTVELSHGVLYYRNDTIEGMSGSPVWIKRSQWTGGRVLVGVHGGRGDAPHSGINRSAFINKAALEFIHKNKL
jgi:V8-like Glu-specific endopeptidase